MFCNDCGNKIRSWQEYCGRCGADLFRKNPAGTTHQHSMFKRFFPHHQ